MSVGRNYFVSRRPSALTHTRTPAHRHTRTPKNTHTSADTRARARISRVLIRVAACGASDGGGLVRTVVK